MPSKHTQHTDGTPAATPAPKAVKPKPTQQHVFSSPTPIDPAPDAVTCHSRSAITRILRHSLTAARQPQDPFRSRRGSALSRRGRSPQVARRRPANPLRHGAPRRRGAHPRRRRAVRKHAAREGHARGPAPWVRPSTPHPSSRGRSGAHVSLAVSASDSLTPLGVLGVDTFTRSGEKWRQTKKTRTTVRGDPERESLRWWRSIEPIEHGRRGLFEAVHVMDAEADFYELLSQMHDAAARFVVRIGQQKRIVLDGGAEISLRTKADELRPSAWRTVELTSRQYVCSPYCADCLPAALASGHGATAARRIPRGGFLRDRAANHALSRLHA